MNATSGPASRTPAQSPDHWENYWRGGEQRDTRDAAVTGAARSEAFRSVWLAFFDDTSLRQNAGDHCFMDLACGGGVVSDIAVSALTAQQLAQIRLMGVDYSISAANQYSTRFQPTGAESVSGIVADALALPFASRSVDVAVSQFGLEYAGVAAVAGAGAVVAEKGAIMCLTHYRSGAIETECRENLRIADAILSSEVFSHVRELFIHRAKQQTPHKLDTGLEALRRLANDSPDSAGKRLLTRLSVDLMRLSVRRAAFAPQEAIGWLDANASEISMYADRMRSMIGAAMDSAQVNEVISHWQSDGLEAEHPVPVTMESASAPSAWRITARRS